MPSSDFRSSASMKKMLTSNRMPARTANMPSDVYSRESEAPVRSARSSTPSLRALRLYCNEPSRATSAALTACDSRAPDSTPPRFETSTSDCGGAPVAAVAPPASDAIVPGATNALSELVSSPVQKPATPSFGSTRTTRSCTDFPYAYAVIDEPTVACRARARSRPIAVSPGAGVEPEIPVAVALPPNVRAAAKSVSSSCDFGAAKPVGDASAASVRVIGKTPSTSGLWYPATRARTAPPAARPLTETTSSTGPSCSYAMRRTDALNVSPTTNDPVMIAVPSNEPSTTSTVSRGRRTALRTASRRNTGRRDNTNKNGSEQIATMITTASKRRERWQRGIGLGQRDPPRCTANELVAHDTAVAHTDETVGAVTDTFVVRHNDQRES